MKDNINEIETGTEKESGGFENGKESLEDVIAENRKEKVIITEKYNDLRSKIEEKIPEAFGDESDSKKNEAVEKEKSLEERAVEAIEEYDRSIGKIANEEKNIHLAKNEELYMATEENKELSNKEIESVIEDYLDGKKGVNGKEKKDFIDLVKGKIEQIINTPITRRGFMKLAVGVAAATISKEYLFDNIGKWWSEYEKEIMLEGVEIEYSDELSGLYERAKIMPMREYDIKKQKLNIDILEEHFNFFERIKNSEKKSLSEFVDILSKTEFDNLSFGVRHNLSPEIANKIIKGLDESGKKFAEFDFEGLSITEESDTEAVKKFNMNELSIKEMADHIQENVEPLIATAREKSINISGTELNKGFDRPVGYGRFAYLSERMKEAMERNNNKGIVVFYGGGAHVTKDTWNFSKRKFREDYNDVSKNNYTIKEFLEKNGYKSVAVLIEDMGHYELEDVGLGDVYENLPRGEQEEFFERMIKLWENYHFESDEPFASKYPKGGENSYSVIDPTKVPSIPPHLNGYKTAYSDDHLSEILNKFPLRAMKRDGKNIELFISIDNKEVPFIKIDGETGKVKKIHFPKQSKE